MAYVILDPDLHYLAEVARKVINERYNLNNISIESSINSNIPLRPTLHGKTKTHIIACEVATRPFPPSISTSFAEIAVTGLPIKIMVAYPRSNSLTTHEYQVDVEKAKKFGIGLLCVDDSIGNIEYAGVSVPLHIPGIEFSRYKKILRPMLFEAYEAYMRDGKPDVGLQKIGQITENIILNTATQAKSLGRFRFTGFNPPNFISQRRLIKELINESVLDLDILVRCSNFAEDRNSVSHKPKNKKEAMEIERNLKENFLKGIRILEEIPECIKAKGFKLQV